MLRFIATAVILATVLATAQPACADPRPAVTANSAETPAGAAEQLAAPEPAPWSAAPTVPAPSSALPGNDSVPVGFGWG